MRTYLAIIAFAFFHLAYGQTIKIEVSRSEMKIGELNQLTIAIDQAVDQAKLLKPKTLKGLRMSPDNPQDSIEIEVRDVEFTAQKLKITISAWDTGVVVIPPFPIDSDSLYMTEAMMFRVVYPQVDDSDEIKDIKEAAFDEELVGGNSIQWDWLWLVFSVLCFALGLWLIGRETKAKTDTQTEPELIDPDVLALQRLDELYSKKWYISDMQKMHFADFSDIMRLYISALYEVDTLEKTTDQLIQALRKKSVSESERSTIYDLLSVADMVKFSKATAFEDEVLRLRQLAENFIKQTASKIHEKPLNREGDGHAS